jgi:stage V sporulation protein B
MFSVTEFAEEIFRIIFSVLLAGGIISGFAGARGIALAFLVSDFLVAIILIVLYFIKGGKLAKPRHIKVVAKTAAPITAMRLVGSLMNSLAAIIIPMRLASLGMPQSEATAEYGRIAGMALPLLFAPLSLIGAIAIVLIPELAADRVKNNEEGVRNNISKALSSTILIAGLFLVVYLPFGREIGEILFKDEKAGIYLQFCALMMIPMCIQSISSSILNSLGYEGRSFIYFIIGTAIMLVLIIALPTFIGIYAVVVGSGACYLLTSCLNMQLIKKRTNINSSFFRTLILIIAFIGPCAYIADVLNAYLVRALSLPLIPAILLSCTLSCFLYFLLIWTFNISDISTFLVRRRRKRIRN